MENITGPKIILVTDLINPYIKWAYTSIVAACNHMENPVDITSRRWSQIVKANKEKYPNGNGYPFDHSGCRIELIQAMTGKDVVRDNPPVVEE